MLPFPIDILPALLLSAAVLTLLAIFMPFTGGRESRRREAWARFDALARIRGISPLDRQLLAAWVQVTSPDAPHQVLSRRKDFDRFSRAELQRLSGFDTEARSAHVARLGALRRQLGFDRSPGHAQSSHDLHRGERLSLRLDDGQKLSLKVLGVDEEGIGVEPQGRRACRLGSGWALFARDGEGIYRFRTAPLCSNRLAHGDFLVQGDRRGDPRVPLPRTPFWVAVERLPDGAAPEDPEGVEVEGVDVSVGGLALLADRSVRKGSELGLDLPLAADGGPMLRGVRAQVLAHGYREGGGPRPHFLHCAFTGLPEAQRKVIEAFVAGRVSPKVNAANT